MTSPMPDLGGTTTERLGRLEDKLDTVAVEVCQLRDHVNGLQQAEDRRFTDRLLPDRVRALEDQMLQTRVYLSQAKWAVAVAAGALIAGVINMGLTLLILSAGHGS
jgi:hypothetical protein